MSDAEKFVLKALIASVVASPKDPGLSVEELQELGREDGYGPGQIKDAVRSHSYERVTDNRIFTVGTMKHFLGQSHVDFQPEFRNIAAMDRIHKYFYEQWKELGSDHLGAERSVLVANCASATIPEHDVEVAITFMIVGEVLHEHDNVIKPAYQMNMRELINSQGHTQKMPMPNGVKAIIERVRDRISRRTDGRPASQEPLEAFRSLLPELGHPQFVSWWTQLTSELRMANRSTAPTSITVMAAALAEGALALIVRFAQSKNLTMRNMPESKKQWKFETLIGAAKSGTSPIIKNELVAQACTKLNKDRQRIHAGRLLESPMEYPHPDFRPEEAREAIQTLDQLLRCIVDWYALNKQGAAH